MQTKDEPREMGTVQLTPEGRLEGYSEDAMIMLTHVPKCAGTSLREAIMAATGIPASRQYRPGGGIKTVMMEHPDDFQCLIGHFPWGVHQAFRPWSKAARRRKIHIATLREPIDQMLSFYYFQKQLGNRSAYQHYVAKTDNIVDFYLIAGKCSNLQSRMYAGLVYSRLWDRSIQLFGEEAMLHRAYSNLVTHYHYWVHHSYLEASLNRLSTGLGVDVSMERVPLTVTKIRAKTEELPESTLNKLRAINSLDVELHKRLDAVLPKFLGLSGCAINGTGSATTTDDRRGQKVDR